MTRFFELFKKDYLAVRRMDPAIPSGFRGVLEILLCTPGFWAITMHRWWHALYVLQVPVLPRFLSLLGRWITGIEIHPGAHIGGGLFIDHGMGVVIGETARIGENVTLYQGVTLGATGNETSFVRHPLVEDDVIVGSGAKVLGDITLGRGARVGAGSVVLHSVLPRSTVVGVPASVVKVDEQFIQSPGNLAGRVKALEEECERLSRMVRDVCGDVSVFEKELEAEAS